MKRKLLTLFSICALSAASAQAQNGSIGVYLDSDGTTCAGQTSGGPLTGSIWANLGGDAAGGGTGAEVRVVSTFTDDYVIVATPNPAANIVIGDPFNILGVNIAFPTCQTDARVQLFTFQVVPLNGNPPEDEWLTLKQRYDYNNPNFPCPLVVLCASESFGLACVGAPDSDHWRAVVNPSVGTSADCQPVAVESTSWSSIKGLYRN